MPDIHRFSDGSYIACNGTALEFCVSAGPGGLPIVLSIEGADVEAVFAAARTALLRRYPVRAGRGVEKAVKIPGAKG